MWSNVRAALLLTIYFIETKQVYADEPMLYWTDFTEHPVPEDAISSGVQIGAGRKPRKLYLSQASFPKKGSGLQPTVLYTGDNRAWATYRNPMYTNTSIKVLCSNMPPEKSGTFLKWVPFNATKTHPDNHLVIVGHEWLNEEANKDINLFFGRAYDGSLFVSGKVVKEKEWKLFFPGIDGERWLKDNIELLVYSKHF